MDWTGIANMALTELGAATIMSIDDAKESARLIKARRDDCLDEVLARRAWSFARHRALAGSDGAAPAFGYAYQYSWPTDPWCLRVLEVNGKSDDGYKLEGRKILTDQAGPLELVFIRRVGDPGLFDPLFRSALAARLAAAVAYRVTQSRTKEADMYKLYEQRLREAVSIPAAVDRPAEEANEDGDWLSVRG